ncbi:MAG: STAS domain-containing protein, partial [Actinomycetota bacterium]|nr:STAS domain-containing protein [Actinomycetota bacterium]
METRELQVTVRDRDGTAVVDLHGEIDRSADERLAQGYADATRTGARTVVLNFEHTEYINSTGIALIVGLLAQARAKGIRISACGLSD